MAILQQNAGEPVIALIRRCHEAERTKRGVVMCLADFNARDNTMTWISVGNVEGVLMHFNADPARRRRSVLMRGGVVGDNLPSLRAEVLRISPGDLLIFATDGIKLGFEQALTSGSTAHLPLTGSPQEIA